MSFMFTAFFIGNIASGKSSATRYLASKGAVRLDLDQMAKELYVPGSALLGSLSDEFGADVLDEEGCVRNAVLAERAFATPERSARLDAIVYPALLDTLKDVLADLDTGHIDPGNFIVIEDSNAVGFKESLVLADEVVAISASPAIRRERALGRGMALEDFEARAAVQPSDEELCSFADTIIDNSSSVEELERQLDAWMRERGIGLCATRIVRPGGSVGNVGDVRD